MARIYSLNPYLIQLQLLILLGGVVAFRDGWLGQWQVVGQIPMHEKYLTYLGHGAVWGMLLFGNPAVAYILQRHGGQWAGTTFGYVLTLWAFVGVGLLIGWCLDPVPSSLARDGQPTIPGLMNYMSMVMVLTVATMYYVCTAPTTINFEDARLLTMLLVVNLALSMVLPPLAVHGSVHGQAWGVFLGGSGLLVLGYIKLVFFPQLYIH